MSEGEIKIIRKGQIPVVANINVAEEPTLERYSKDHVYLKINEILIRITVDSIAHTKEHGYTVGIQVDVNTPELVERFEAQDEIIQTSATKH